MHGNSSCKIRREISFDVRSLSKLLKVNINSLHKKKKKEASKQLMKNQLINEVMVNSLNLLIPNILVYLFNLRKSEY